MVKLVGLKNCDTCRKAKKWLESEGMDFEFHDVRQDGLTKDDLKVWVKELGWEALLNKRGTTWRGLDDSVKDGVDEAKAIELMVAYPALMKRPLFITPKGIILGFKQEQVDALCQL